MAILGNYFVKSTVQPVSKGYAPIAKKKIPQNSKNQIFASILHTTAWKYPKANPMICKGKISSKKERNGAGNLKKTVRLMMQQDQIAFLLHDVKILP